MRVGLHALGIGSGARREVIDATAKAAEAHGFATLWAGEHVVMIDGTSSRYPYSADGRIPVATDADWLDPVIALSFAAAATSSIRIATGILLLPEHNPVLLAKQVASLDVLSGGRFVLGVGIGWSADEFEALGVPFKGRARRTAEYVSAMRTLWRDDVATFSGETTRFKGVRVNPRPVRDRRVPILFGGNSDAALSRAAAFGDGWYGFNLTPEEAADRVVTLRRMCVEKDRSPDAVEVALALIEARPEQKRELAAAGVDEGVVVASPPEDPRLIAPWIDELAQAWLA